MKTNAILTSIIVVAIISLLTTCKKYPDNDLWFKSPESAFTGGSITAYTIDGVDSIPMWNNIYNTYPYNGFPAPTIPFNFSGNSWRIDDKNNIIESAFGSGSYHFFSNKKYIYIYFKMVVLSNNQPPNYNIFYTTESTWKILKLTKNGIFRIQRTYNNKVYEIEFN